MRDRPKRALSLFLLCAVIASVLRESGPSPLEEVLRGLFVAVRTADWRTGVNLCHRAVT